MDLEAIKRWRSTEYLVRSRRVRFDWLIAEVERLTDRIEQVTLERDIAKLAIKYKNELIAGTVGSGELNITICNEGFATTAYNLSLATSGAPLTKNMLYDVVLVPKRQY